METYKSDAHSINQNITTIFGILTNPAKYLKVIQERANELPPEAKEHLDKVKFGEESISIESPMGAITLGVDKEETVEPTRIVYSANNSPVKFALKIELEKVDENTTSEVAMLELDIPFFMAKMVAPQLKDGAKKFGEMLAMIPYDKVGDTTEA